MPHPRIRSTRRQHQDSTAYHTAFPGEGRGKKHVREEAGAWQRHELLRRSILVKLGIN
jgi:hypothetical protein